jgi:predicted ATP-dependent protease
VTYKVEGYFELCRSRGLTGEHGVIIPASNVVNLMLSDDVVAAVEAGQFHVWAIDNVDQGIEWLTGLPAGERGADGEFPEGTIHRLVEDHLTGYAHRLQRFAAAGASMTNGAGSGAVLPTIAETS